MARKKKDKADPDIEGTGKKGKKGKKKKLIVIVLVIVLGAAGYVVMGRGGKAAAAPAPKPGAVVALTAIHLNLDNGHYLKLGLALQATTDAKEPPDGSKALDIAIELFSNRTVAGLATAAAREKAKKELVSRVTKAYEGDVMDVYFTEFVSQ